MKPFDFNELFIFDMANNHQGDVTHGRRIIDSVGDVVNKEGVRGAIKFQFRQLDSFIHPSYVDSKENKHIPRFLSTRLNKDQFGELTNAVREAGLHTMCTPFDEESVDVIGELGIEIIKVASCSAADKPLLAKVADAGKPVVASTAGLSSSQLDHLVGLFRAKNVHFALMHCVAIYPTPFDKLRLNQIEYLLTRYPEVPVGFSTHEDQDDYIPVRIAYAKGARLFERHVGLETDKYKLNAYSSRPNQLVKWIEAFKEVKQMCGGEHRAPAPVEEIESLASLKRGVYARKAVKKGETIRRADVYFAMPFQPGHLESGLWKDSLTADKDYVKDEPLAASLTRLEPTQKEIVYDIMLQVQGLLSNARVVVGSDNGVELSHHYGIERFREFGAVIIDCVNREYCKKLIVMLPRQKHPYHYHKKKEETFQLLYGDMEIEADGHSYQLKPGETFLVEPGTWHKFHTLDGAIVEEISTTHYKNDSFYEDERINKMGLEKRKTKIENISQAVTL